MPEWPCPALDGYTASGKTEYETAKNLSAHLLDTHCRAPLPGIDPDLIDADVVNPDVAGDRVDDIDVKARVEAGPVKGEVNTRGR